MDSFLFIVLISCIEYLMTDLTFLVEPSILLVLELANDVVKAFADVLRFWLILFCFLYRVINSSFAYDLDKFTDKKELP